MVSVALGDAQDNRSLLTPCLGLTWFVPSETEATARGLVSFSHSVVGLSLSLSFGISQSLQHFWSRFPDDLATTIKGPHRVATPFELLQDCRYFSVIGFA
jgi:hypothetical protein